MPEFVLTVARFGFLVLLWIFVFTVVGVIRRDLFAGVRSKSIVASPRGVGGAVLQGRVERMHRSSLILTFGGGTNEIQRDIIARAGLGLPAVPR